MILIGWMMRAIILGAKFDECRACHVPGPHLVLRKTHWFTVFRIPTLLLWVQHGLLCPNCGDYSSLSFLKLGRAFRDGRLPLDRKRPVYEAAVRESVGATDPADWAAMGLSPDASPAMLKSRWHELAKSLHPDKGGDTQAFVRMQATYQRLVSAPNIAIGTLPDPAEIFDPVVKNPKRGFFDAYLKVWIAIALISMSVSWFQSATRDTAASTSSTTPAIAAPAFQATSFGTSHVCWSSGSTLNGCRDDTSSAMLFGTPTGVVVTCFFVEPLLAGQTARCR
jgi:hypothetical protein